MVQPVITRGVFPSIKRGVYANWRVALAFWVGILLSIASFYTTWNGMVQFVAPRAEDQGLLTLTLSGFITTGIQVVMLLAAWMVGLAIIQASAPYQSGGRRLTQAAYGTLWFLLFGMTLVVSSFFSYHTFYTAIANYAGGSDAAAGGDGEAVKAQGNRSRHMNSLAELHVRESIADGLSDMRQQADTQRQAMFKALTLSPDSLNRDEKTVLDGAVHLTGPHLAWVAYRTSMADFKDFATSSDKAIGAQQKADFEKARKEAEKRAREQAERQAQARAAEDRASVAEADKKKKGTDLAATQAAIDAAKVELDRLKQQEIVAQKTIDCEDRGRDCPDGSKARAGKGPKYREAQQKLKDAKRDIGLKNKGMSDLEGEATRLRAGLEASVKALEDASAARSALSTPSDIPALLGRAIPIVVSPADFQTQVRAMDTALGKLTTPDAFGEPAAKTATPTRTAPTTTLPPVPETSSTIAAPGPTPIDTAPLVTLTTACEQVKQYLSSESYNRTPAPGRASEMVATVARKHQCNPVGVAAQIARIQELNAGLRAFDEKQCRTLGREYRGSNTEKLVKRGQDCLEAVALEGAPANEYERLFSALDRDHSGDVHPFVQSYNGLVNYSDKLAYLSVFLAVTIDMLVFFAGLVGGNESLRRTDRPGKELRGQDAINLALAAASAGRPTDSEEIKIKRALIHRMHPQDYRPFPDRPHIIYAGYILDSELKRGVPEDDHILAALTFWTGTPKAGVDLVLRTPRPEQAPEPKADPGYIEIGHRSNVDAPVVRYFLSRELLIDLAEDIVHWDKAFAKSETSYDVVQPPPTVEEQRAARRDTSARPPNADNGNWSTWLKGQPRRGSSTRPGAGTDANDFMVVNPQGKPVRPNVSGPKGPSGNGSEQA